MMGPGSVPPGIDLSFREGYRRSGTGVAGNQGIYPGRGLTTGPAPSSSSTHRQDDVSMYTTGQTGDLGHASLDGSPRRDYDVQTSGGQLACPQLGAAPTSNEFIGDFHGSMANPSSGKDLYGGGGCLGYGPGS